jgi:hypothetical protein
MSVSPVLKGGNQLRTYQLEGVNWLLYNAYACACVAMRGG